MSRKKKRPNRNVSFWTAGKNLCPNGSIFKVSIDKSLMSQYLIFFIYTNFFEFSPQVIVTQLQRPSNSYLWNHDLELSPGDNTLNWYVSDHGLMYLWPPKTLVVEGLILLPSYPKYWDYRCIPL